MQHIETEQECEGISAIRKELRPKAPDVFTTLIVHNKNCDRYAATKIC